MSASIAAVSVAGDPIAEWSRRVRRVGGIIQLAFAVFWLIRGSLAVGGRAGTFLVTAFVALGLGVLTYAVRFTRDVAPRPAGLEARRLERAITVATVVQLVASFAAPAAVLAVGRGEWVLPSIAVTIGPLLLWLDHRVGIRRYKVAGWMLIVGPVLLGATVSGSALTASTGIGAGLLLLAVAAAGFHDLAVIRRGPS